MYNFKKSCISSVKMLKPNSVWSALTYIVFVFHTMKVNGAYQLFGTNILQNVIIFG